MNVTTDKVYKNREWEWGYREGEELNGYDPYSNSKSCSELVTDSYKNSFFMNSDTAISTVRAGNVIGGGDFATDRIIPDCIRAAVNGEDIIVRNPYSTRPYQHVLEPVIFYLYLAIKQFEDRNVEGCYNIGPNDENCIQTGELVQLFCDIWNKRCGSNINWKNEHDGGPHEANFLKLDSSKIKGEFDWKQRWDIKKTIELIIDWQRVYGNKEDIASKMQEQIKEYL